MNFRVKLLTAFLAAVATVSGVTLWLTQSRVVLAYDRLFQQHAAAQIAYLPQEQEARLGVARQKSAEFTTQSAVRLAMSQRNSGRLYQLAHLQLQRVLAEEFQRLHEELGEDDARKIRDEARAQMSITLREWATRITGDSPLPAAKFGASLLTGDMAGMSTAAQREIKVRLAGEIDKMAKVFERPGATNSSGTGMAKTTAVPRPAAAAIRFGDTPAESEPRPKMPGARTASYMIFIDAEGQALPAPHRAESFFDTAFRRAFRLRMGELAQSLAQTDSQQVGYVHLEIGRAGHLVETISTPVHDEDGSKIVGTLVLGFPFQERGEERINEVSAMKSGIWGDGRLHSWTIPAATQRQLSPMLSLNIGEDKVAHSLPLVQLDGVPHRVFVAPMNAGSKLPVAYKVGLYSWADTLTGMQELRSQIFFIAGVLALISIALSWALSINLARPLRSLTGAARQIKNGNYDVRLPQRSGDEMGQLAAAFNDMAEGLAMRDKYKDVLNKVVDPDVAAEMMKGELGLGGETKVVTILFCDIREFTSLTEPMTPEQTIVLLNEHMTALTRVVDEHNGVVDKFVGDLLMAVFGTPHSKGNDAENAVRCARQMVLERHRMNARAKDPVKIGVGIATGEVLVGCMGSKDRLSYTVIGQRVNLASRLCDQAGCMEVIIDQTTKERIGTPIPLCELPPVQLKGFPESMPAYRVLIQSQAVTQA